MRSWAAPSAETPRRMTVRGATGSIGRSTLALVAEAPDSYRVEAVTGFSRVDALAAIARRHGARLAVIGDPGASPIAGNPYQANAKSESRSSDARTRVFLFIICPFGRICVAQGNENRLQSRAHRCEPCLSFPVAAAR